MASVKKLGTLFAAALLLTSMLLAPPEAEARHHVSTSHSIQHRFKRAGRHTHSRRSSRHHRARFHKKVHKAAVHRLAPQTGVLVVTESGETILDQLSDVAFNPASVAKMVTAYGALKQFGVNHRFTTNVSMTGKLDSKTGVLTGNLYVSGNDPDFERDDALALRQRLSEAGIKRINGKLVASPDFSLSSVSDAGWSVRGLSRIWGIRAKKGVAIGVVPSDAVPVAEQASEPFRETLKEMLSYSQNGVAEQIGRCAGGIVKLEDVVSREVGLTPGSLQFATASGLGRNRAKPKDMMVVLKGFRQELQRQGLDLQDMFPVAGVDAGTLDERFTDPAERGSVVGKTGTLPGTDGGASALLGMFRTQQEDMYFVIFCWRGNVVSFRQQQDQLIRKIQATRGGPKPFGYNLPETISSNVR